MSDDIEVLPPDESYTPRLPQTSVRHIKDPVISAQARVLGSYGLTKGATAKALRIRLSLLESHYWDEYCEGQADMQKKIAALAMEAAESGSVPMIMYLCKTKLGWTETAVVEHVGEVRAVVSNRPLSRDEFVDRYLKKKESDVEGV